MTDAVFTASPFLFLFLFNPCPSQSDFFPHVPSPDVGPSSPLGPVHSLESLPQPTPALLHFLRYHRLLDLGHIHYYPTLFCSWPSPFHILFPRSLLPIPLSLFLYPFCELSTILSYHQEAFSSLYPHFFLSFSNILFYFQEAFSSRYPLYFFTFNFFQCSPFYILYSRGFLLFIPPFPSFIFQLLQRPSFIFYIQEAFSSLYPLFSLPFQFLPVSVFSHFIFKRLSPLYTPLFFYPFNFFQCPSFHILYSRGFLLSIPPFFLPLSVFSHFRSKRLSPLYTPLFFYPFNFFHCPSFHILDPRGFLLFIPPFLSISRFNFFKLSSFPSFPDSFGIHKIQNPIYFISAQPIPHTSRLHSVTSHSFTLCSLHYTTLLNTFPIYIYYYSRDLNSNLSVRNK